MILLRCVGAVSYRVLGSLLAARSNLMMKSSGEWDLLALIIVHCVPALLHYSDPLSYYYHHV